MLCPHIPRCSVAHPRFCWHPVYVAGLTRFLARTGRSPVALAYQRGPGLAARVREHLDARGRGRQ